MTEKEFIQAVKNKLNYIQGMFEVKNDQYSTDKDPLANFTTGARLMYGDNGFSVQYEALKAYAAKHIAHVYNNGLTGAKVQESIDDIICYFVIASVLADQELKERG
jgi:hypothetical protein|nr:MAG TPA: hypothetical protein [Bacteriophage sp.]